MTQGQKTEIMRLADALDDDTTYVSLTMMRQAANELRRQHARIAELEKENSYMNNACAELEAQLDATGAGGVEPLSKGFVRLADVLARLEQGFGANSAPVTTIKRHFEMQAHPTQQGLTEDALSVVEALPRYSFGRKGDEPTIYVFGCSDGMFLRRREVVEALAAQAKQGDK